LLAAFGHFARELGVEPLRRRGGVAAVLRVAQFEDESTARGPQ